MRKREKDNKEEKEKAEENLIKNLTPIPNNIHSTSASEVLAEFEKEKKIEEEKEKKRRRSKNKSRRFSNPKYRKAKGTIKEEDEENES